MLILKEMKEKIFIKIIKIKFIEFGSNKQKIIIHVG